MDCMRKLQKPSEIARARQWVWFAETELNVWYHVQAVTKLVFYDCTLVHFTYFAHTNTRTYAHTFGARTTHMTSVSFKYGASFSNELQMCLCLQHLENRAIHQFSLLLSFSPRLSLLLSLFLFLSSSLLLSLSNICHSFWIWFGNAMLNADVFNKLFIIIFERQFDCFKCITFPSLDAIAKLYCV